MTVVYGLPTSSKIQRKTPTSDFVPKDFAEMYEHYYVYVLRLLTNKGGIDFQNADDVAQTLFIKMDEKGLLTQFDPSLEFNGRPAVFTTFLSGFVLKYARHYANRQMIHKRREGESPDVLVPGEFGVPDVWLDVYGPHFEEEYTTLHDEEFRTRIRSHLRTASTGRKDSQLDFVALFDEIDRQVIEDGKYSTTRLMEVFGVTRTTVHTWLEKLRAEVAKVVTDD